MPFGKTTVAAVDIFPLFRHPALTRAVTAAFVRHTQSLPGFSTITSLVIFEVRGFLFGPPNIAQALSLPFVPVRKKGKTAGPITPMP